jgi:site-specific DNA-methyltransferase (adenine-specific)
MQERPRAPRNRTLTLDENERGLFSERLLRLERPASVRNVLDQTICQDTVDALHLFPQSFVDLLIVDPPYNLSKTFNTVSFSAVSNDEYSSWFSTWFAPLMRTLKPTASVYICSEWRTSSVVCEVASRHLNVRNRITWEREKGRGALRNWKNCSEDIWFCTVSDDYVFNLEAVKLRRRVIAPYRDQAGRPKDWTNSNEGNYRVTHPSNVWTDITVPFWSMPENTDHPTQKPEKLIAKLVLASSNEGNVVLDPFVGSGTTSVVAKKLGRRYVGIEKDHSYCCLAEKRLHLAERDRRIQGYENGLFWERNTLLEQIRTQQPKPEVLTQDVLFGDQSRG